MREVLNEEQLRVGKNVVVGGHDKSFMAEGEGLESLNYLVARVINAPSDIAFEVYAPIETTYMRSNRHVEEGFSEQDQIELADNLSRLNTALLERCFIFGDEKLKQIILGGQK